MTEFLSQLFLVWVTYSGLSDLCEGRAVFLGQAHKKERYSERSRGFDLVLLSSSASKYFEIRLTPESQGKNHFV